MVEFYTYLGCGPSSSAFMNCAEWVAPQSEVTKPVNPSSWRRISVRVRSVAAGMRSVHTVIGAHHRRDLGLDRGLERR
jgi:hypothetical protein